MAIDASIYSNRLLPPKSVNDYDNEALATQQNKLALLAAQTQNQQAQQGFADDQAMRQATMQSGGDTNKLLTALQASGNYKGAQAIQKAQLDTQKAQADIGKTNADTGHIKAQTSESHTKDIANAFGMHRDQLTTVNDPQTAAEWVKSIYADPLTGEIASKMGDVNTAISRIPKDPQGFAQWKMQASLSADNYFKKTVVDANTAATNATSRANNAANNATSRANNADSNARMSSNAGGGMQADDTQTENIAQMIASGRMAPLGQMAMRSPAGVKIMSRVAELNPEFRAQTFATGSKAEKDFATGKQGNSVRSFNVALSHLDTLDQLSDALNNKDTQLINKIGNYYATQTGNPAPTNFEATKKIVADEIVKSIVGSGGGVTDREEAAKTIQAANSPAQLKGVISSYKELMRGQIHGLQDQYKASTGRDDFDKYLSDNAKQYSSPSKPKATAPTKTQSGATVSNW